MDKLEVPAYEKKKGIECVNAGKYEEATKHFSKVESNNSISKSRPFSR